MRPTEHEKRGGLRPVKSTTRDETVTVKNRSQLSRVEVVFKNETKRWKTGGDNFSSLCSRLKTFKTDNQTER